jgi:hypothetical protein
MRWNYLVTASLMTLRDLFRRKFVVLLLLLIPSIFYAVTHLTTDLFAIPFQLAAVEGKPGLMVPARHIGLVFMGLGSAGLLAAFLSMNLIQRNAQVVRRLIICGYTASEIAISRLLVMFAVIVFLGFYVCSMLWIFFDPENFLMVVLGFVMVGFVYGSYGLLIGSLLKGELEGILLITLLSNIDVGWLQNPIFYAGALNKAIIRVLPAFYPSQLSIISAFSEHSAGRALAGSMVYGGILLILALFIFWLRMRKR